jgi:predicted secreted protein
MPAPLAIATFITIWWVALFAVFPFVIRPRGESEADGAPAGLDPGAPLAPRLLRTALWTTLVSAVVFGVVDAGVYLMG